MMEFSNGLSPAETERLALLMEEMAETSQIIGKILRHGYESHHPNAPFITNRELLEKELGHVKFAMHLMMSSADLDPKELARHCAMKEINIRPYLHHN